MFPTSTAEKPASAIAWASSTERMALSATATTSGGFREASRVPVDRSSPKSRRLRLVTPTIRAPGRQGALDARLVVRLHQGGQAEFGGLGVQVGERGVVGQGGHDEEDGVGTRRRAS